MRRSLDARGGPEQSTPAIDCRRRDWKLRYKEGMWELTGWVGGSRVTAMREQSLHCKRSSAHYFQRPDQTHISYDRQSRQCRATPRRFVRQELQASARSAAFSSQCARRGSRSTTWVR